MNYLKRAFYFLTFVFSLEYLFPTVFAYDSVLSEGLSRIGYTFANIFRNKYIIISLFFFIYLFILYIIFKEVLLKISLFKDKNNTANKLSLLLSLISTFGLFYYGYNGSENINEFLVTYLGLPGLLGIIVFDILIYKIVMQSFDSFVETSPEEVKGTLRMGLYGIIISVASLITLIYVEFLITNLTV